MPAALVHDRAQLRAVLISPNRPLARELTARFAETHPGVIVAELNEYPAPERLKLFLEHFRPDFALVDAGSNLQEAENLIGSLLRRTRPLPAIALHAAPDDQLTLRVLRAGAADSLTAPFTCDAPREALQTVVRRLHSSDREECNADGQIIGFCSAKPGSGASVLSIHTAFALRKLTGQRVLYVDFDLAGGSSHRWVVAKETHLALPDLLEEPDLLEPRSRCRKPVAHLHGVDVLTSAATPWMQRPSEAAVRAVLHALRRRYDWVVADLPNIMHPLTHMAAGELTQMAVVTTSELSALHLASKWMPLLEDYGVDPAGVLLIVNRVSSDDLIPVSEMERAVCAHVSFLVPNDYFALYATGAAGHPLMGGGRLARAIRQIAVGLSGVAETPEPAAAGLDTKVLAEAAA